MKESSERAEVLRKVQARSEYVYSGFPKEDQDEHLTYVSKWPCNLEVRTSPLQIQTSEKEVKGQLQSQLRVSLESGWFFSIEEASNKLRSLLKGSGGEEMVRSLEKEGIRAEQYFRPINNTHELWWLVQKVVGLLQNPESSIGLERIYFGYSSAQENEMLKSSVFRIAHRAPDFNTAFNDIVDSALLCQSIKGGGRLRYNIVKLSIEINNKSNQYDVARSIGLGIDEKKKKELMKGVKSDEGLRAKKG